MLKIKDDVNLKELEKFGFKPKYDEDTGEIEAYVEENTKITFKRLCINRKNVKSILRIYKKSEKWSISADSDYFDIDTLYDLITAGLVEKC